VAIVLTVVWSIFPIYWMLNISLMNEPDVLDRPPNWIPNPLTFNHYTSIIGWTKELSRIVSGQEESIRRGIANSFIVGTSSSLIAMALATLGAYAFARFQFRFKGGYFFILLLSRMLPPVSIIVPYYLIFSTSHLVGTHVGLIITYVAALIPINIWLLLGIFSSLPIEVESSARVDGCGRLKTYSSVVLRMASAAIISMGLLAFGTIWNDFTYAQLIAAGSPAQTLQSSISGLFAHYVVFSLTGAAVTIGMIPSIILIIIFGRRITQLRGLGSMTLREAA